MRKSSKRQSSEDAVQLTRRRARNKRRKERLEQLTQSRLRHWLKRLVALKTELTETQRALTAANARLDQYVNAKTTPVPEGSLVTQATESTS